VTPVKLIYSPELKTIAPIIIEKLKEKMMTSSDAIIEIIIIAKSEIDRPNTTARFLMFL